MVKRGEQPDEQENMAAIAQELGATELSVTGNDALVASNLVPTVSDDDLRGITSYEDALALAEAINGTVTDISERLGSGFELLDNKDKSKLEGKGFIALLWRFTKGDFGMFASMALVTVDGERYIVNDGSAGIMRQLAELSSAVNPVFGGLRVPRGLRMSDYKTCPKCNRPMPQDQVMCDTPGCGYDGEERSKGETYYLDTAASKN